MSKSKAVAKVESFAVEMPETSPALGFNPELPSFNWREVLPSNYWSMDELEERKEQLGGWPVLTPAKVVIKPVYDPAEYEGKEPPLSELTPKIVLEFAEASPALVMNKSRCEMATKITGTPNPTQWASKLGKVVLSVGVYNRKGQIILEAAPAEKSKAAKQSLDDLNKDLFG